jgi:AbiV family abortive infection protein
VAARRTEIPIDRLQRGVQLALRSGHRLALAAFAAVNAEDAHAAAVLLYQAAEEVGKAKMLSDHLADSKPLATAKLRDHAEKFRLALTVVPPDCLELWGPAFDPRAFQPDVFQTEPIRVDWDRRQAALYADWDEDHGEWRDPTPPQPRVVRRSATRMADFIDHAIADGLTRTDPNPGV